MTTELGADVFAGTRSVADDLRADLRKPARATAPTASHWVILRPVLVFHVIMRMLSVLAMLIAAPLRGRSFSDAVTRWDGQWYYRVAVLGYPSPPPQHADGWYQSSTAAFFPLYPWLVNQLRAVGLEYWQAGLLINFIASTAAVLIIVLVGLEYLDRRPAQLLGCLWAAFPMSGVLMTTYTEAVFTLFGAAALLFALRRRWLLAGLAAGLAGAVRSPGLVFAGAVGLAALIAIIRHRPMPTGELVRALIGAALAPLGFLASVGYIGVVTGDPNAWRNTERDGWRTKLTWGRDWLGFFHEPLSTVNGRLHLVIAIFGAVLIMMMIIAVILRPPLPIIALMLVGTFLAFGYGGIMMNAAPRVMMSFFPILSPFAILMARWRIGVQWALLTVSGLAAVVIGSYYFTFAPIPI